jgi:hypothetical protein
MSTGSNSVTQVTVTTAMDPHLYGAGESMARKTERAEASFVETIVGRWGGLRSIQNLRDATLGNEGAAKFLAGCEADSMNLENCPGHIREWIERVKRSDQAPTDSMNGSSRAASSFSATRRLLAAFRP